MYSYRNKPQRKFNFPRPDNFDPAFNFIFYPYSILCTPSAANLPN